MAPSGPLKLCNVLSTPAGVILNIVPLTYVPPPNVVPQKF
jgi:hypothetical protein